MMAFMTYEDELENKKKILEDKINKKKEILYD